MTLGSTQSVAALKTKTIDDLIQSGQSLPSVGERVLGPGEAKRKIAFLCFSSGTTGKPKVFFYFPAILIGLKALQAVAISHYNIISNVVQVATFKRISEAYAPWEERQLRPGDVCCGGTFIGIPRLHSQALSCIKF